MKRNLYLIIICIVAGVLTTRAQGKQNLRVLYVGGSPEVETSGGSEYDSLTIEKSVKARMASFEKFLRSRFRTVKTVRGEAYTAALSDEYDVTVFDGRPVPIRPLIVERDASGRVTRYERPAYLPDDFDRPALCIANASEEIGRSIGTKCDWYCLCLEADAHHWVKEHPIFQGPFKVNIEPEMKPTPAAAFEVGKMYGYELPAETEMWTVQTKSYTTDPTYRIGMVSRPGGFLDSPEAEVISSGVCAKSIDAVAIGRHGNFLHWGFSASPAYLTEAGKAALANAIVYISQFAGQHVIARKLNEGIATRHDAEAQGYLASRECWESYIASNRLFYHTLDSIAQVARAKQAKGETLSSTEKAYVNFTVPPIKVEPTYAEYVKERFPSLYHIFGDDAEEYARYFKKNRPWFRPDAEEYHLDIDEEVRTLGIANNDIRLLERCITMLEQNEEPELATRVLHRYTLCRFATPQEWRTWFEANRERMFFSESGGWLWLVNTMDRSVPGNDYNVRKREQEAARAAKSAAPAAKPKQQPEALETDDRNPVAAVMTVRPLPNGNKELTVRVKVHTDYHIYAQVFGEDPFIPTELKFELPEGWQLAGALQTPAVSPLGESATTVYTGECLFRQEVSGTGSGEAKCTLSYQCCDRNICFPPAKKEMAVKL